MSETVRSEQLVELLNTYDSGAEKYPDAMCPLAVVDVAVVGGDCTGVLEATQPLEGSFDTEDGTMFVYRACGSSACAAVFGLEISCDNKILYTGRFRSPCVGAQQ